MRRRVLFLPGALGAGAFWRPVGELLPPAWEKVYLDWPELGSQEPDPRIQGLDDLAGLVEQELRPGSDLVAQSMGGVVAVLVALRRPESVRRLVLVATSGGVDISDLGAYDWRPGYAASNPGAPAWVAAEQPDRSAELGSIAAPTLLLWGDDDPIAPVAAGERLRSLLPHATLNVIAGGTHGLAAEHADEVAPMIAAHLSAGSAD